MSWIIDTFSAKPSGFLASWRYRRVRVDENGNLSSEPVPGKQNLDQPCLSDYNRVDRRYRDGDLITEFCNLDTFTNYRIYAQNCTPFAFVQTDLNAPKCGYLEPLPEPAVPPNPFGNAVYGEYYYFDYCDIEGVPISVKIFKKSYAGVPIKVDEGGKSPVVLDYKIADTDNKFSPIRACECIITFNSLVDFQFQRFYTDDEREYKVEIRKGGELKFAGYIIPDTAEEPFVATPYPITIRATDGVAALKNITYPLPIGSDIRIRQSFRDIIAYCLAMTNLPLNIRTITNLYETKMANTIDDDPLVQATVSPLRMADSKGNIFSAYDALTAVCELFGARFYQQDGCWNFERINELSGNVIRRRNYNYTGLFLFSEEVTFLRVAGKDQDIELINKDHNIRTGNAYKRVETLLKFGETPAVLFNGNFEDFDGQNFRYWTKFGGINISQVQRTIRGSGGIVLPIQDFCCSFNEKNNSGKWIQANPIMIRKGDKIAISIDLSALFVNTFKMRIKVGKYYLFNQPTTTEYNWVTSLSTASINVNYFSDNITPNVQSFANYTLNMPEAPESGDMIIQLFGFNNTGPDGSDTTPFGLGAGLIDNVSISVNTPEGKNLPDGQLNLSEQLGFYTNSPEQIELIYGDYVEDFTIVNAPFNFQLNINGYINPFGPTVNSIDLDSAIANGIVQTTINDIYAIRTSDGSYSTAWYEYGQSNDRLPIGLTTAKAILKAYQKPFRYIDGSYRGQNLSYGDLIRYEVPNNQPFSNRVFMIMEGQFDLKYNTLTGCSVVEIFSKNINSNDATIPHSPGDISPPITQNPNNPSPDTVVGIFTEEFTEQFL